MNVKTKEIGTIDDADRSRFWSFVDKDGPVMRPELGPCWVWTGGLITDGYGAFWINGHQRRAPRVSYQMANGAIPVGLWVLHRCDHPKCVRPEHLFVGTAAVNTADMTSKGRKAHGPDMQRERRHATGERNGARTHPERLKRGADHYAVAAPEKVLRGERHGRALLTNARAFELKRRAMAGERKVALSAEFGVSVAAIYDMCSGKTWKHIDISKGNPE